MTIEISLDQPVEQLTLDAEGLTILEAWVDGQACRWRLSPGRLVLALSKQPVSGAATIRVTFTGFINEKPQGLYLSANFVATQLQPSHARRVFPCFDEAGFKTTFDVSVCTDAAHRVLSNAASLSDEVVSHRRRVVFARTPPIPVYLLAIAAGAFNSRSLEGEEDCAIAFHSLGNAGRGPFALEIARQSLAFYGRWLDRPYPFGKLDLVALPTTGVAGMENTGAVFLREAAVAIDPATASSNARRQAASLVAHELAHQWFGSLVTPESWADLWLNEGFATWMAPKALAAIDPALTSDAEEVRAIRLALDADDPATSRPLCTNGETPQQVDELFDAITYRKGAALLRMLEAWLGETPFRKGLALYFVRHAGATAAANDLWNALQEATGVDVAAVARPFTEYAGAPQLTFAWRDDVVTVSQEVDQIRPVPVRLTVGLTDGQRISRVLVLDTASAQLAFPGPVQWIFGNADAAGYYYCRYASAGRLPLTELSPSEAVVLLEDAWQALWRGDWDLLQYLNLAGAALRACRGLESLGVHLEEFRDLLAGGARQPFFDRWIIENLGPARDSEASRLMLGQAGDAETITVARRQADGWLAGSMVPDAGLDEPLDLAARHGDAALFDQMHSALERALAAGAEGKDQLLRGIIAFRLAGRLTQQLELLRHPKLEDADIVIAAEGLLANPFSRAAAWAFLKMHWDDLRGKVIGLGGRGAIPALSAFTDPAVLADVSAFFAGHEPAGAEQALHQSLQRIAGRSYFRERSQATFDAWLMRLGAAGERPSDHQRTEHALVNAMAAGFRGALQQRLLFDRYGLGAPPWMHSADNLRGALAQAERLVAQSFRGGSIVNASTTQLAQRLGEDLLACADQVGRNISKLARAADRDSVCAVVAALGRTGASLERELEGAITSAALNGDEAMADNFRRQLREARSLSRETRHWIDDATGTAPSRATRLVLQNDAALVAGQLRVQAASLAADLVKLSGGAPGDVAVTWSAYGFKPAVADAWRAAGFAEAAEGAAWFLRGFEPAEARRRAQEGADPRAMRMRPVPPPPTARRAKVRVNGSTFSVEVAADPPTRAQGLMHRDTLAPGGGMLFVFPDERQRPFFMKNVRFPLDILWLTDDRRVTHVEANVAPWRDAPVPQDSARSLCRYVLEISGGAAAKHGVRVGDQLDIAGLDGLRPS